MSTSIDSRSWKAARSAQSIEENPAVTEITFIRLPQVKATTGLSKTTIYEKMKNHDFPSPVLISKRAVAWVESEVRQWAASQISARVVREPVSPKSGRFACAGHPMRKTV